MNMRTSGCAACAVVAGLLLSGCAAAPADPPDPVDISQVPGLESTLYVSESASVARPAQPAPSAEDLARAAMQEQTKGMAPGAVAGGSKDQVVIRIQEANAPETAGAKPMLVVPALQPGAESRPPEEEKSWKTPLPPLRSLEGE
jgi:hypothetical protein